MQWKWKLLLQRKICANCTEPANSATTKSSVQLLYCSVHPCCAVCCRAQCKKVEASAEVLDPSMIGGWGGTGLSYSLPGTAAASWESWNWLAAAAACESESYPSPPKSTPPKLDSSQLKMKVNALYPAQQHYHSGVGNQMFY